MNMEITQQERNDLLERDEIELDIDHTGEPTPSANDIRSQLAAEQDLDPETIRVDHVYSSTGRGSSVGEVTVFDEPVVDLSDETEEADEEPEEPADEEASTEEETEEDIEEEEAEDTEDADETAEADEDDTEE